jgi:hypothetical protein
MSAAQSSSKENCQPSSVVDGFALTGASHYPDPATHAYRKDLADVALASCVIASHYAEPLARRIVASMPFRAAPNDDAAQLGVLGEGDEIRMLDMTGGWAWGYGPDGRVGYVRSEAVGI